MRDRGNGGTVAERAVVEELVEEENDVHVVQRVESLADLVHRGRLDDRRMLRYTNKTKNNNKVGVLL